MDRSGFNPLMPRSHKSVKIAKISFQKLEGIKENNLNERRVYESVDDRSLYQAISQILTERRTQTLKGLLTIE